MGPEDEEDLMDFESNPLFGYGCIAVDESMLDSLDDIDEQDIDIPEFVQPINAP